MILLLFFSLMMETYLHKREKKFFALTRENAEREGENKILQPAPSVFFQSLPGYQQSNIAISPPLCFLSRGKKELLESNTSAF